MFDKSECARVKAIVKRALEAEGFEVFLGGGTYCPTDVRFTVKVMEDSNESAKAEWDRICCASRPNIGGGASGDHEAVSTG